MKIIFAGFYRVNYDQTLWSAIESALKGDNFGNISVINRALIVDDVFTFARASQIEYSRALDIISYLENEIEYYPWHAAFTSFSFLRRRIGQDETLEPHLRVRNIEFFYTHIKFRVKVDLPRKKTEF